MNNQMFIVSAVSEIHQAESIMSTNHVNGINCASVFEHQLQTAVRCLSRLNDIRKDRQSQNQVSDSEIEMAISFLNDLINLK